MARKIALVCDSTADFPPGMAKKLGLHIMPVHIFVDGKDHLHGESITNTEVIKTLKKKKEVRTAPFYPFECTRLYEELLSNYDEVVSFHLSRELSGNYKSACAAREFLDKQDAARVHVYDMGSVSISLGLMVKKAVGLLRKGVPPADLKRHLGPFRDKLFFGFTVENLLWLKKGGRVNAFEAFMGNMLDVKPIIQLRDARLVPMEKHRGKKTALKRLVAMAEETFQSLNGKCEIWMAYADNLDEVMISREKIAQSIGKPPENIALAELGATISVHTGPGSALVSVMPN